MRPYHISSHIRYSDAENRHGDKESRRSSTKQAEKGIKKMKTPLTIPSDRHWRYQRRIYLQNQSFTFDNTDSEASFEPTMYDKNTPPPLTTPPTTSIQTKITLTLTEEVETICQPTAEILEDKVQEDAEEVEEMEDVGGRRRHRGR